MFGSKKKNRKAVEVESDSNANPVPAEVGEAEAKTESVLTEAAAIKAMDNLTLTENEMHDLLYRIDEGYTPTDEEVAELKKVKEISFSGKAKIPKSIGLLTSLQELDLSGTNITDLSDIKKLTCLRMLDLSFTQITNLSGIEELISLQELNLRYMQITSLSGIEKLTSLRMLDLGRTKITDLSGIEKLTGLQELDISWTNITDLSGIEKLTGLQELDISWTKITDLSGIKKLTSLQELDLNGTNITDLSGIEKLTGLQELDISWTNITDLSGIEKLTGLQWLNLSQTKITDLSGIKNLTCLQKLNLSWTKITDLSGIEKLTGLQKLDLRLTKIDSNELKKLSNLKELRRIDLRNLRLAEIPEELLGLNLPFYTTWDMVSSSVDSGIFLYGTELTNQSLSLFGQDRSLIEEYYNKQTKSSTSEAKVIFLGYGGVGKTHTIERIKLEGAKISSISGATRGISITSVADFDNSELNVQFWDFGGQDIMHSMHRCFLTERCCYVIVVNSRHGDVNKQARYWLNNVKSYAPSAPVILFENRWGEGRIGGGLDEPRLKEDFSNIKSTYSFSALEVSETSFNEQLVAGIHSIFNENSSITLVLPVEWAKVHDKLLELNDSDRPFIEKDEYYKICQDCGETSDTTPRKLLSWFNDLGICFSYHMDKNTNIELESYQLFAPNWIINAMYTIINNSANLNENGIIFRESINNMLTAGSEALKESLAPEARYEGKTDYILEIMRKHKLSFEISETQEFIPALCVNKTPKDLHPTEWKKHTTYKYVYNFLPDNVVHRMMICYREKNMLPAKLWLKGFRIDDHAYDIVLVIDMAKEDNILLIDIYSLDDFKPYKQFKLLKGIVSDINSNLGLTPYESITVEKDGIKQDIPVNTLRKMWREHKPTLTILDQTNYAEIKLDEVIEGIIAPGELLNAGRSTDSMAMEERAMELARANDYAGGGNTYYNIRCNSYVAGGGSHNGDNIYTENHNYTYKQLMELMDKINPDMITQGMIDKIAADVEGLRQQNNNNTAIADALNKIADAIASGKAPKTKWAKFCETVSKIGPTALGVADLIFKIVSAATSIAPVA